MTGPNALAPPAAAHPHGTPHRTRTARRTPADGNRRPVQERCAHHHPTHHAAPGHNAGAAGIVVAAPLWRTMMERWLTATP
ncbi:hypothetical protein [Azospirillum sp. TSO35-2]|uniref:hypothetical protein n=1 Tax=Azospirillum sp. TSO35-2 TaxID=716796 RepID=UPI000D61F667|nr:hypothetical protein [Azospirillum sp. TSO35-2]PWC39308.1 hypothetical protein TSO352_03725 [Azospirillum sp. TSO35-2]